MNANARASGSRDSDRKKTPASLDLLVLSLSSSDPRDVKRRSVYQPRRREDPRGGIEARARILAKRPRVLTPPIADSKGVARCHPTLRSFIRHPKFAEVSLPPAYLISPSGQLTAADIENTSSSSSKLFSIATPQSIDTPTRHRKHPYYSHPSPRSPHHFIPPTYPSTYLPTRTHVLCGPSSALRRCVECNSRTGARGTSLSPSRPPPPTVSLCRPFSRAPRSGSFVPGRPPSLARALTPSSSSSSSGTLGLARVRTTERTRREGERSATPSAARAREGVTRCRRPREGGRGAAR